MINKLKLDFCGKNPDNHDELLVARFCIQVLQTEVRSNHNILITAEKCLRSEGKRKL